MTTGHEAMIVHPTGKGPNKKSIAIIVRRAFSGGSGHQAMILGESLQRDGHAVAVVALQGSGRWVPRVGSAPTVVELGTGDTRSRVAGVVVRFRRWVIGPVARLLMMRLRRADGRWQRNGVWRWLLALAVALSEQSIARRAKEVRTTIERLGSDTVVSFLPITNFETAVALWRHPAWLVCSERNPPFPIKPTLDDTRVIVSARADRFGANTESAAKWLHQTFRRPDEPVAFTPNILVELPGRQAPRTSRLLVVSRLERTKGVDHALAALACLDPRLGAELHIVGDGDLRESLESEAAKASLPVKFYGHVDSPESVFCDGGILLQLSGQDGTPNSIMEAMSWGVPCIVSDQCPGPVRLVSDGLEECAAGLVVDGNSPEEVASAVERILTEPGLADKLALGGRRRATAMLWHYQRATWSELLNL